MSDLSGGYSSTSFPPLWGDITSPLLKYSPPAELPYYDLASLSGYAPADPFGPGEYIRLGDGTKATWDGLTWKLVGEAGAGGGPGPQSPMIGDPYHVVRTGDTLWAISQAWGVTVEQAAECNAIDDPDHIEVGWTLVKPGSPPPTSANTKAEIMAWLTCAGIEHNASMTKAELLELV